MTESDLGDQLEAYSETVDFEIFRADLNTALAYSDGTKGGRPPYDAVLMFKILIIQAQNNLSDDRAEFLISDRLSFMRFLGLGLHDRVPDAKTIWAFRERLTQARAIEGLFTRFDGALKEAGYIAMSGQLVDSSLIAAPKQRNTKEEKAAIKEGKTAEEIWSDSPAKARQKDVDARWTIQFAKARKREDGPAPPDIAIPTFGYKAHTGIDNRSKKNEAFIDKQGFTSHVHYRKPKGRPMPEHIRRGNNTRSKHRAPIEHVYAVQKNIFGLTVRTIGIARAKTKIGLANIAYNMRRLVQVQRQSAA